MIGVRPSSGRDLPSGARSGALIALASLAAIGLNYAFLVAAGRLLGREDYGALAALLGLLTVVLLPTGALQLAVSREVSWRLARGETQAAEAFCWATLRLGLLAALPIFALSLGFAVPIKAALNIDSTGVVIVTSVALVTAFAYPIAIGVLQGYQRFYTLAGMYLVPFALRLGLLGLAAVVGFRLGGAMLATVAAMIASCALAIALVRSPLVRGARIAHPSLRPFLRYLWPVLVSLIGVAALTNIDVLVVRARFPSDETGEYAAAAAFARVAFFLPATILTVLFPRTAARQARGEDTADILGRALLVTAAVGILLTLLYGVAGSWLLRLSFGAEFSDAAGLLTMFAVAMALFGLANILVGFHLSRGEMRYGLILAAAAPVQIAILALVPSGREGVILANVAIAIALLVLHETLVESSLPALRAGLRRFVLDFRTRPTKPGELRKSSDEHER